MLIVMFVAALWYMAGLVGAGFVVADNIERDRRFGLWSDRDREEKRREAIGFGVGWAIDGPIVLVLGYLLSGFGQYGWWDYRRPPTR